ncbi:MAG: chloride channel protein [Ruminococcaceae bacterium]|nr:chloride channel protein [Oscillospiraceae bacterium]
MITYLKNNCKISANYVKTLLKWLILATAVGVLGGFIGSAFHISVDWVTELRTKSDWILFLLPLGGLMITALYHLFCYKGRIDTNRVLEAVRSDEKVPLVMVPLIFVSTVITHLLGGSAGREGAALQLGGGIGYNVGKVFNLKKNDRHIIVMAGMSSVFAALFGTPMTAAVFALEVVNVGALHYAGLLPCVIASVTAFLISGWLEIPPVRFNVAVQSVTVTGLAQVALLAVLCAIVSILFCTAIKQCEHYGGKLIKNQYVRTLVGSVLIILLALVLQTRDYNGAGMDIITCALGGEAKPEAFLLKIIFTAITITAGFKGGEIVPAFFVGSTFGCVVGSLLGLDAGFAAAIGFVALFCGAVNCPLASLLLSVEVFGAEGILFFAITCGISYMMSGHFGLYKSQRFMYSKLDDSPVEN